MTLLPSDNNHLTSPNSRIDELARATHPGMAFWSGTGPVSTTCRECVHFKQEGYYRSKGRELKPAKCGKYKSMMGGAAGASIPNDARSCKYFEAHEKPPARFEKGGA